MNEHAKNGPSTMNYVMVFVSLTILTALTVALSYTSLGEGTKEVLAFVIASFKAILVALIFMNLKYESPVIAIFAIAPVVLAVLFILAISPDIGVAQ